MKTARLAGLILVVMGVLFVVSGLDQLKRSGRTSPRAVPTQPGPSGGMAGFELAQVIECGGLPWPERPLRAGLACLALGVPMLAVAIGVELRRNA